MNEQIIAVDFDGTLCENKWPEIGEPNTELISYLIEMRKTFDAKIILWTCRAGEMLDKAVNWCLLASGLFLFCRKTTPPLLYSFA